MIKQIKTKISNRTTSLLYVLTLFLFQAPCHSMITDDADEKNFIVTHQPTKTDEETRDTIFFLGHTHSEYSCILEDKETHLVLDSNEKGDVYTSTFNGRNSQRWYVKQKEGTNIFELENYKIHRLLDSNGKGWVLPTLTIKLASNGGI